MLPMEFGILDSRDWRSICIWKLCIRNHNFRMGICRRPLWKLCIFWKGILQVLLCVPFSAHLMQYKHRYHRVIKMDWLCSSQHCRTFFQRGFWHACTNIGSMLMQDERLSFFSLRIFHSISHKTLPQLPKICALIVRVLHQKYLISSAFFDSKLII